MFNSTWIHIRPRIRRAKFNNFRKFSLQERTVVAVYARSSTTERQPDCFQRVACLQSVNSWELISKDELIVWPKKFQSRDKTKTSTFASNDEYSSKPKNLDVSSRTHNLFWQVKRSNESKWTRACPELPNVFRLFETISPVDKLQKQDMQWTQLWKAAQQTFAQWLLVEGDYKECIRCNNSSSN